MHIAQFLQFQDQPEPDLIALHCDVKGFSVYLEPDTRLYTNICLKKYIILPTGHRGMLASNSTAGTFTLYTYKESSFIEITLDMLPDSHVVATAF